MQSSHLSALHGSGIADGRTLSSFLSERTGDGPPYLPAMDARCAGECAPGGRKNVCVVLPADWIDFYRCRNQAATRPADKAGNGGGRGFQPVSSAGRAGALLSSGRRTLADTLLDQFHCRRGSGIGFYMGRGVVV